jgi:hypothetical protein
MHVDCAGPFGGDEVATDGTAGQVVSGVTVCGLKCFCCVHLKGDLVAGFRLGGEFTLTAQRLHQVSYEQRGVGTGVDRHIVPPSSKETCDRGTTRRGAWMGSERVFFFKCGVRAEELRTSLWVGQSSSREW